MIDKIVKYLKNKKIIILGFGLEGQSTYNFIRKYLKDKKIAIQYSNKDIELIDKLLNVDSNLEVIEESEYLNIIEDYDIIIKSPGISFKNIDISKFKNKITSQLQLFLEFSENFTIGITGTKGKSTTSSLIYKVLQDQKKEAILLGNIGIPIFDYIEKLSKDVIVVLELSSHQLEYVKLSTNIAILLNIYEEHLDHYSSLSKYIESKFNIFKYQNKKDIAIYNFDNLIMKKYNYNYNIEKTYAVSLNNIGNSEQIKNKIYIKDDFIYYNNEIIYDINSVRNLKGNHNLNNIMFVLGVSIILNLNITDTIKTITEFNALEHRIEYVGNFDKVDYYNDSIATIPEATIETIKALKDVNTLIVRWK